MAIVKKAFLFLLIVNYLYIIAAQNTAPWPSPAHDIQFSFRANPKTPIPSEKLCETKTEYGVDGSFLLPTEELALISTFQNTFDQNTKTKNSDSQLLMNTTNLDQVVGWGPSKFFFASNGKVSYFATQYQKNGGSNTNATINFGAYLTESEDRIPGKLLWETTFKGLRPYGPNPLWNNFIDTIEVMFTASDGSALITHINATNGEQMWQKVVSTTSGENVAILAVSPISGDVVVFAGEGQGRYKLTTFAQSNGETLWETTLPAGSPLACVVSDNDILAVNVMNLIVGVNVSSGDILWQINVEPASSLIPSLALLAGNETQVSPIVVWTSNSPVYGLGNSIMVVDPTSGTILLKSPASWNGYPSAVISIGNSIVVSGYGLDFSGPNQPQTGVIDLSSFEWNDPVLLADRECNFLNVRADGTLFGSCSFNTGALFYSLLFRFEQC